MITQQMIEYIKAAIASGQSREAITLALVQNGWSMLDINDAFASIAGFPSVPQPTQPAQPTASSTQSGDGRLISVGQLLSDSWSLYKQRALVLVGILATPYVFLFLGQLSSPTGSSINTGNAMAGGVSLVLILVGTLFLIPAIPAAIFAIAKGTGVFDSFRQGIRLFFSFIWWGLLCYLVAMGGFVMLIIPCFLMAIWFVFSIFTFALEDKRGLNALLQSREYTRGYWWAIFGRLVVVYAIIFIPVYVLQLVVGLVLGKTAGMIAYYLLIVVAAPFSVAYSYKIYQSLTILKPTLATTTPTSGRGFLIASAILGLLVPIIVIVSSVLLVALQRAQVLGQEAAAKSELSNATTTEATPYTNTTYGFSITPPTGWQTRENPKVGIISFSDLNVAKNIAYINVDLVSGENLSLADFAKSVAEKGKKTPGTSIINSEQVSCGNSACYLIENKITDSTKGSVLHGLILIAQAPDGNFFIVFSQSTEDSWSTFSTSIKHSLLSFTSSGQ